MTFCLGRCRDSGFRPGDRDLFNVAEILFAALDAVLQQLVDQVIGEMELIREKEDRLHIGGA